MDDSQVKKVRLFFEKKYKVKLTDDQCQEIAHNLIHLAKAVTRFNRIQEGEKK